MTEFEVCYIPRVGHIPDFKEDITTNKFSLTNKSTVRMALIALGHPIFLIRSIKQKNGYHF